MFKYNDVEGSAPEERLSPDARADLQCNILNSTSRFRSTQLFVRFETEAQFREWLRAIPSITSEDAQVRSDPAFNLLFTATGLRKLQLQQQLENMDPAFKRGARDAQTLAKLRDPDPHTWRGHEQPWDAALLIHSNHPPSPPLPRGPYHLEDGNSLDASGQLIPPEAHPDTPRFNVYGYLDGISVNHYEGDHPPTANGYDARCKLSTLLVRDPLSEQTPRFGSYFVFRKYEQNVGAFDEKVEQIARAIEQREQTPGNAVPLSQRFSVFEGVTGGPLRELVKAWIMGRFPDGRPLLAWAGPNDFMLDVHDPDGLRCPFHAHIAKMNPRGRTGDRDQECTRRIARRGISYGRRGAPEAGLLFWCAQARIEDQFEYIQQHWANDSQVDVALRATPDLDNVIGKRRDRGNFEDVTDPYPSVRRYDRWKETIDFDFGIYDTIHLRGAEYFYAPSLPAIDAIKAAKEGS